MADKDYAPLSAACVRALNDRMYERRKAAALEIGMPMVQFIVLEIIFFNQFKTSLYIIRLKRHYNL